MPRSYTQPGGRIASRAARGRPRVRRGQDNGIGIPPRRSCRRSSTCSCRSACAPTAPAASVSASHWRSSLVELHGGTIAVASGGRGSGSTFRVDLPLRRAPPRCARARARSAWSRSPDASPRLRIVVVDDNDDARELVADILASAGHEVASRRDGPSGLELILELRPDAALIDIGLPGMTGLDVVRALRSGAPHSTTRLVAFTGYCGADSMARATAAGFDDHLVKPATMEAMLRCLAPAQIDDVPPPAAADRVLRHAEPR